MRPIGFSARDEMAYACETRRRQASFMRRNKVQSLAVPAIDIAELGVADADGILQHCFKHRLKFAGRAADNLQHLRGRRLLLQRFGRGRLCAGAVR